MYIYIYICVYVCVYIYIYIHMEDPGAMGEFGEEEVMDGNRKPPIPNPKHGILFIDNW